MAFTVKAHRLYRDKEPVRFNRTPNQGSVIQPSMIVLHDTAGPSLSSAENWFKNSSSKASAHLILDRDGSLVQMGDFNRRLWHAGRSIWKGRPDVNNRAIGIEIVNPGRLSVLGDGRYMTAYKRTLTDGADGSFQEGSQKFGGYSWSGYWQDYTPTQIEMVIEICTALVDKYPIQEIVTHWMISPGRKVDVNPLFPLDLVRDRSFGHAADKNDPRYNVQNGNGGPQVEILAETPLRRYPSFYPTNVVIDLAAGQRCDVLNHGSFEPVGPEAPVVPDALSWLKVRLDEEHTGWVLKDLTNPIV